jgi:predicted transcriptional regulator
LKLSAHAYARLLGVSALSVYNWENGKSRPRRSQFERLISLRGIGRREALKMLSTPKAPASKNLRRRKPR